MNTLFESPFLIPYCILMIVVYEENYCNYIRQMQNNTSLLYWHSWYSGTIILCNIIAVITLFVLCITSTWWFLAFSAFSIVTWIPLLARFMTRMLDVIIASLLAFIVEILISIYFVVNWFLILFHYFGQ